MQVSLPWTCMWQRFNEHIDVFLHAPPRKSAVGALSVYRFPLSKLLKVAVVIFGLPPGVAFFPDGNAWEQDISTSETENGDSLQVHCTLSWQILGYNDTGHQQAESLHRTHLQFICELSSVTSPTNALPMLKTLRPPGPPAPGIPPPILLELRPPWDTASTGVQYEDWQWLNTRPGPNTVAFSKALLLTKNKGIRKSSEGTYGRSSFK